MGLCVKEDKCTTSCVARDCVELKYLIPYSLQDAKFDDLKGVFQPS